MNSLLCWVEDFLTAHISFSQNTQVASLTDRKLTESSLLEWVGLSLGEGLGWQHPCVLQRLSALPPISPCERPDTPQSMDLWLIMVGMPASVVTLNSSAVSLASLQGSIAYEWCPEIPLVSYLLMFFQIEWPILQNLCGQDCPSI